MRQLAERRDIHIGAAVAYEPLAQEQLYAQILGKEFNLLTPENVMKFELIHPDPERYDFLAADFLVDFAKENAMRVHGHTLVWHQQLPGWVVNGKWNRDTLAEALQAHIAAVVGRYRGRVATWDVVNEGIDENGALRQTFWLKNLGEDYIEQAFRWAHSADPEALLFYNDYGAEEINRKSDAIYQMAQEFLKRGVPIHGIGLQMHITEDNPPDLEKVQRNIHRLGELGLIVHITELDIRIREPVSKAKLDHQAEIYGAILKMCLEEPACQAIVIWGFTDKYSWIPYFFEHYNDALIFDREYQPKPAYLELVEILSEP